MATARAPRRERLASAPPARKGSECWIRSVHLKEAVTAQRKRQPTLRPVPWIDIFPPHGFHVQQYVRGVLVEEIAPPGARAGRGKRQAKWFTVNVTGYTRAGDPPVAVAQTRICTRAPEITAFLTRERDNRELSKEQTTRNARGL